MNYISVTEAAVTMNVSVKILREMCERGMIKGAIRFGRIWAIPEECCRAELLFQRRSYPWVKSNEKNACY